MRFKYYIRGFGFGMILTTIVLIVSFKLHGEMTEDQIRKEAMKLGMVESVDTQKNPSDNKDSLINDSETESEDSQKEDTQKVDTQKEDSQKDSQSQAPESQTEEKNPSSEGNKPQQGSTEADSQKPDKNEPEVTTSIKITIENGDSCRMVAEKLYANKLIDDVENFREYIRKNKWANDFHTGVYMIPVGATYDDIAKILIPSYNK